MNVKSVDNLNQLIEQSEQLFKQVKGEAMTIAEAFEQRGRKIGETKVAINLLKKGMPVVEVAEVTELKLSVIEELYNQIHDQIH